MKTARSLLVPRLNGSHGCRSAFSKCILTLSILLSAVRVSATESSIPVEVISNRQDWRDGSVTLHDQGRSTPLAADSADFPGVIRALKNFGTDIGRVTGTEPEILFNRLPDSGEVVIAGTLGKNRWIDRLAAEGRIETSRISGRWEATLIQVLEKPFPGVSRALVIAGSDKRGTIYGLYGLSGDIGVSPWYWWADVPVQKRPWLAVTPGWDVDDGPAVKYRGIFINDEAPCLSGWTREKFGGFNHLFYEKVFELILRLKGNYLWPAMWGNAFNTDDPLNPILADEYGIVMGTSHHEPMLRAQQEWKQFGKGEWNYDHNEEGLKTFWKQGIAAMDGHESIVTVGMRGDGDLPMTEGANIALLERIVADQRKIIAEVTGRDPSETPQDWALYKEVQEYYDKGMRVPDDVTLLLCDDNWGNVRRLPDPKDPPRSGGYGMYYHFDFVGGPRNYKWLNTNPIARVWEQMHLCYRYGVDRIWIVNVGDIKPMEYPISFFLDYAWDPDRWPADRLTDYAVGWAERQFGTRHGREIADLVTETLRIISRRKPEMLGPETFSLTAYREADRIVEEWRSLEAKSGEIQRVLSPEYHDAFYQLVLHPIEACANLNDLYVTVAKNRLYAKQGRASANDLAQRARDLFSRDAEISRFYNQDLAGGKWNHMMDQTHIGYTYWQQPEKDAMPKVEEIQIPKNGGMGVAVEGSELWWPEEKGNAVLPEMDAFAKQTRFIDVFSRGRKAVKFKVRSGAPWLSVTPERGEVQKERRLTVAVDWASVPAGKHRVPIIVEGPGKTRVLVHADVFNPPVRAESYRDAFVESEGVVSIESAHWTDAVEPAAVRWTRIPGFGRTASGVTPFPVTAEPSVPGGDSPRIEYKLILFHEGDVTVHAYFSPTQNFTAGPGFRYGVSFDDGPIRIVNVHENDTIPDWKYPQWWNRAVGENIRIYQTKHGGLNSGIHVLKFWMVDPGLVLQKLVVDAGGLKPSYLGPPESPKR
ncbi:MAG: glycosyl hydrolase 115 family protein [bacterium]|nr:glycosyl hydrolase 115 family protein [bacterium]